MTQHNNCGTLALIYGWLQETGGIDWQITTLPHPSHPSPTLHMQAHREAEDSSFPSCEELILYEKDKNKDALVFWNKCKLLMF